MILFLAWLALATSIVMLALLAAAGELDRRDVATATLVCLAAYVQFFVRAPVLPAIGLAVQTLLAIYLILRWRWTTP